ncbi:MAG: endonuclease III domain-containing protein [candidate division WOR-3 bacterium]
MLGAVLSTRTRDETTAQAFRRLTAVAPTPAALAGLKTGEIRRLIYPVGFYRTKARLLKKLAQQLLTHHHGSVPRTRAELLHLPGVGPKVASIVLSQAFGLPVVAVDTHVHRLSNRLGLVRTTRPEQTERRLNAIVPEELKAELNPLLVALGQTICLPRNPHCPDCPLKNLCPQRRVRAARDGQKSPGMPADKPGGKFQNGPALPICP